MVAPLLPLFLIASLLPGCGKDRPLGPDTTPPSAVTDLTLLRATETSITVTWTAPGDDGDKGRAASYDLRYSLAALPASWDSATVVASTTAPLPAGGQETVTVTGLTRDRIYYLALRALDDAGNESDLSNVLQAQAGDSSPPGQVTDLEAGTLEPHAVTLLFTAPGDDGTVGTAAAYDVRKSASPVTESTWESATPLSVTQSPQSAFHPESVRVTGFSPLETVHIALRARDDGGNVGPVSNDLEVTLPPDTVAPAAIKDLTAGGTELFTQTLTWTAPGNDGSEGRATGYAIRFAETAITQVTWGNATPVSVSLIPKEAGEREELTLTGLPGRKNLWFSVRAADDVGNWSPVSNAIKGYVKGAPRTWVIRVDQSGDAPTVQAGIDSAGAGDTVLVYPGRYYENLDYLGKDLVLRSAEGPEATILDGSLRDSSVVVIRRGETRAAVLEGFTITGGRGSSVRGGNRGGGGVCCDESWPTIRGNKIVGNACGGYGVGGGISAGARYINPPSGALIEGNVFEDNQVGLNGGGLACFNGAYVVRNNVFRDNQAAADGGGIWFWMLRGQVALEGNEFYGNEAGDHGGGVYAASAAYTEPWTIESNLFVRNRTVGTSHHRGDSGSGAGMAVLTMNGLIRHNTLVSNEGQDSTESGGGGILLYATTSDLHIYGNLIAFNTESGIACWGATAATVGVNLLWGNDGGDLGTGRGQCPEAWSGIMIFADPLFCDLDNDEYHVASNSPALTGEEVMGAFEESGCGPRKAGSVNPGRCLTTLARE